MKCPKCGSTDIVHDSGITTCTECATIIEENNIVSDVTFVEGANGTSSVLGQFVPSTGTGRTYRRGMPAFSKESREATIENGRRRISQIAATLRLNAHHIEAAQRLFMLAVQHNFIQGRKTQNVVAACLYIVCRREKTPHMLIDFSDVLQTNVYVLGHTFLKFCRLLNLQLPIIDPSLYIQRFAAKLEFEDKAHVVATTALRIVQRMRRDWIQTGRRPAGICGAGLLIAARLHGFRRTQREIIQVVRICDVTLRRRLNEFEETPSGQLTAEEFESVDLEEECDPPAFAKARAKDAEVLRQVEKANESEMQLVYPKKAGGQDELLEKEMEEALNSTELQGVTADTLHHLPLPTSSLPSSSSSSSSSSSFTNSAGVVGFTVQLSGPVPSSSSSSSSSSTTASSSSSSSSSFSSSSSSSSSFSSSSANTVSEQQEEEEQKFESLSDVEDAEIDECLLTADEIALKSQVWHDVNKDYILQQEQKAKEEKENNEKEMPPKKRRKRNTKSSGPAESAAAATTEMLQKRVSSKINYNAVEHLFTVDQRMMEMTNTRLERVSAPASSSWSTTRRVTEGESLILGKRKEPEVQEEEEVPLMFDHEEGGEDEEDL